MRVFRHRANIPDDLGPTAIALGIFDGVHRGHQELFKETKALAKAEKLFSMAYTFHPHPAAILNPKLAPHLIESVETRISQIEAEGIAGTLVEPFDAQFATISAEEFIDHILVEQINVKHIVVGEGFRFGAGQKGDVDLLIKKGRKHGFKVHPQELLRLDGLVVSSTKIREFVQNGHMRGAEFLLGRPFCLRGDVIRGAGRGSTIGVPTANLETRNELLPALGVYATRAKGVFGELPAVTNVGFAPTFGENALTIETHIFGDDIPELYDTEFQVAFIERLREEKRFAGVEDLKNQIALDIEKAKSVLGVA